MKDIKHKLITAGIIIVWLFACNGGFSQTYNPAQGTVSNKPYAPAQATPTDSRSYFYDASNFIWRPYQSTTEVLSYLNLSKYRTGQFSIYVNATGTLNPDGTFTGGTITEYWFKDGTANGNLIAKTDATKANQQALIDTASAIRSVLSARVNPIAGTNMNITGSYPNLTFNSTASGSTVSITANTGTGAVVTPTPITGSGVISNDTSGVLSTRLYTQYLIDLNEVTPDTLVLVNIPTSGLSLMYSSLTSDTGFIKRIKSGSATTVAQNTDSSIQVNMGGTATSNIDILTPTYTYTVDGDSSDLTLNTTRAELRWTGARTTNDLAYIRATGSGGTPFIDFTTGGYLGNNNWGSSFMRLTNKFGFEVYPNNRGGLSNSTTDSSGSSYILAYGTENGTAKQSSIGIDPRRIYLNAWDSITASRPMQYVGNIHSLFTPYSLIDKSTLDSVISTTASATIDFGNASAQTSIDSTITLTGATVGDIVVLGVPNASVSANSCFTAWVSATNTITVRFNNYSSGAIDPASGTFKVKILR